MVCTVVCTVLVAAFVAERCGARIEWGAPKANYLDVGAIGRCPHVSKNLMGWIVVRVGDPQARRWYVDITGGHLGLSRIEPSRAGTTAPPTLSRSYGPIAIEQYRQGPPTCTWGMTEPTSDEDRRLQSLSENTWQADIIGIWISLWLLIAITGSWPLYACIRGPLRRRIRRRVQCCVACGYNLHGNVSGVCPECGEAVCQPGGENSG